MGNPAQIHYCEIACQQVLEKDATVFSIQWVLVPELHARDMTPGELLRLYLAHICFVTYPVVRPVVTDDGVEFRLLRSSVCLLKFSGPVYGDVPGGKKATLFISGGVLVQPRYCDRGALDFLVEHQGESVKLTLQLSDFCPLLLGSRQPSRWRKWLYRLTQAYIHKLVTVRFLSRVYRRLDGRRARTRVVKVALRPGEDI